MKKVLITGCAGLVGSAVSELFREKGWEVIGVDNNGRAGFFNTEIQDFQGIQLNICDEQKVNQLFIDHKFDAIVHTAAQPSHDYSKDHVLEDFLVNAWGTVVLLEATRKYRPKATFVHISTDKVYGENMNGEKLSDENLGLDFAGKRSPFGCSKTAADVYAQEYANYFDMTVGIFRPGCITGKKHQGAELHGFLAYIAKCVKEGITYNIFGNGKNVRDQIHADDLASAIYAYVENPTKGGVYNIGGGPERAVSVLEAIKLIEQETGKKCTYEFKEVRKGDRLYDVHDVTKFRTDYPNWDYKYSLKDIIKDLC